MGSWIPQTPTVLFSGLFSRNVFCKESLPFDLEGPILEDVCRLSRFVLNGVDVTI